MADTRPDLIKPKELADEWQLSEKTLSNWRSAGIGPPYVKLHGAVRYSRKRSEKWLADEQKNRGGAA